MNIEDAIACLKANGYKVIKPKARLVLQPGLNAVGKPYSPQFDPNWKRKQPLTSIKRLFAPMPSQTVWK